MGLHILSDHDETYPASVLVFALLARS